MSGLVGEAARLREEVRKVRTEESVIDTALQSVEVLQAEVVAIWDQLARFYRLAATLQSGMSLFVPLFGKR